jgi:hypothetical protein
VDSLVGKAVLGASGAGYPITQLTIQRFGRRGAAAVELACLALLARDSMMIARGTPKVLRPGPAALLWLECAAAIVAAAANARLLVEASPAENAAAKPGSRSEMVRRLATAALFGLHTARFRIYLRPDQGRRLPVPGAAVAGRSAAGRAPV